ELRGDPRHVAQAGDVVARDAGRLGVLLPPARGPIANPVADPPLAAAADRPQPAPRRHPLRLPEVVLRYPGDLRDRAGGAPAGPRRRRDVARGPGRGTTRRRKRPYGI